MDPRKGVRELRSLYQWEHVKEITVLGTPKALKRHRTVRLKNGCIRNYDPSEKDKADFLGQLLKEAPEKPYSEPLMVDIDVFVPRPKSHYRTGKYSHLLRDDAPDFVDKRPDKDNYEKFVLDALNGIYWTDDSIIVTGRTTKYYSEIPGLTIKIKKLTRKE